MVIWLFLGKYSIEFFTMLGFGAFFGTIFLLYNTYKKKRLFGDNYRKTVISSMIKIYNPEIDYRPAQMISPLVIEASTIFPINGNKYEGCNYMCFKANDFSWESSEVQASIEMRSGGSYKKSIYFSGIFISFHLKSSFAGYTLLMSEKKFWIPNFLPSDPYKSYNKVTLNDAEFEKRFELFSNNDEQTNKILIPDFKQKLLELRKWLESDIAISFINNSVNLSIRSHVVDFSNLFSYHSANYIPDLNKSALDPVELKRHANRFKSQLQIIDTIKSIVEQIP